MPRAIEDWYLATDGNDIGPAWNRCMAGGDGLEPIRSDSQELGAHVVFGPQTYRITSPLQVTRRMIVTGEGPENTRVLCVQSGALHIRFRDDATNPRPGCGGQESRFSDITFQYSGPRTHPHHGVLVNARAHLERVFSAGFTGDAFRIDGDVTVQPKTGANLCQLHACRAIEVDGAGFRTKGGDANANLFLGCDATNTMAGGFVDESFLGNFYLGAHANIKKRPDGSFPFAFICKGQSARSVFIVYAEGANLVDVDAPSMVLPIEGGALAPGATAAFLRTLTSGLDFASKVQFTGSTESEIANPSPGVAHEHRSTRDTHALRLERTTGAQGEWWRMTRGNASFTAFGIRADAKVAGAPSELWAPQVSLGPVTGRRSLTVAAQAPAANVGTIGDVVLAATPTATLDGWRKVQGANGAEWRAFAWPSGA